MVLKRKLIKNTLEKNNGLACAGPWVKQNNMLFSSKIIVLCCLNSSRIEAHNICIKTEKNMEKIYGVYPYVFGKESSVTIFYLT